MYETVFEGFSPVMGIGDTCWPMRKGKGGKRVLLLLHMMATMTGTRRWIWSWFNNLYRSNLLKKQLDRQ